MKRLLEKEFWQIPEFLRNKHLRIIAVFLLILSLVCATLAFIVNAWLGIIVFLLILLTIGLSFITLKQVMQDTTHYISDLSYKIKRSEQEALLKMPIGILMLNDLAEVVWVNPTMQKLFGQEEILGKKLTEADEELAKVINDNMSNKDSVEIKWQDKRFNMLVQNDINVVYLLDITHYAEIQKQYDDSRLVIGQIFIDNYDEVTQSMNDTNISNLSNYITNELSSWASQMGMFLKMIDEDHYFVLAYTKSLTQMEKEKFKLLDRIRERTSKQNFPVTLSIGLAYGGTDLAKLSRLSQSNLDLALGRGGDQVVVKNNKGISYYGGKREQTAKNTRVKARVKAEALREFITGKERVIVMGHKMADVDSFGAAIGIYRAASAMKKKVNIVLNDISVTLRPLYEAFTDDPKYPDDLFVTSHEAEELADDNTMVVVVDTNKPKMTECERLLRLTKTIAVLDHHRQSDEVIENAVLSYIEPYASSACEMVAEVLQYIGDDLRLNSMEANSMYAGILVDTNNFMSRTGVRTFEAAAYLRRCGADVTYVRKLLRDDMASYRAKAAVISSAEVYRDVFAIARGEHLGIESHTIIGAQASNELLNIEEIKASFVLTEYNGKIYISARSIDEINVQIIMERLGGGGHINTAGAQFPYSDMERAIETLKKTIDIMIEEGDI